MSEPRKRRAWDARERRAPRIVLTDRDHGIIRAVLDYRFLTTTQIAERFFSSRGKAVERLRELYDAKLLNRIHRPVTAGRAELIYSITTKGYRLIRDEQTRKWTAQDNAVKPEFLDHELAVNETRLALERSLDGTGNRITFWKYDRDLRRELGKTHHIAKFTLPIGQTGEAVIVNPDAYLGIETAKGSTFFFLELDRSTETAERVFGKKLQAYRLYLEQGFYREQFKHGFFRVLTITQTDERLKSLLAVAVRIAGPLGLLFWFTTRERLIAETALGAIWQNAKEPERSVALLA